MSATYEVRYTDAARSDLLRLFDDLLDRAETVEDFDAAQATIDAVRQAVEVNLRAAPFVYRKAGESPFLREQLIPLGASGYVALCEIKNVRHIDVLAVRHQLEDDYH